MGGSTGADVAQQAATQAADDHASRDERGKPRWRTAARLAMVAILAGMVTIYHRDLVRSFGALRHLSGRWFVLAAAAEMASVLSFAFSRRRLLSASGQATRPLGHDPDHLRGQRPVDVAAVRGHRAGRRLRVPAVPPPGRGLGHRGLGAGPVRDLLHLVAGRAADGRGHLGRGEHGRRGRVRRGRDLPGAGGGGAAGHPVRTGPHLAQPAVHPAGPGGPAAASQPQPSAPGWRTSRSGWRGSWTGSPACACRPAAIWPCSGCPR